MEEQLTAEKITIDRVVEHLRSIAIRGVIPKQDIQSLVNLTNELLERVSSLTKERQEMVEALMGIMESCDPENTSHETIWRIAYSVMNQKP